MNENVTSTGVVNTTGSTGNNVNSGMSCYKHQGRNVVGSCKQCGKFMCQECLDENKNGLCPDCSKEQYEQKKKNYQANVKANQSNAVGELIKIALISGVLAVIGFMIASGDGISSGITMAWLFAGFPWGWKIINQILTGDTMTWFLVMTEKFWIIAYIIKFALAFFIGAVAWPFKLIFSIINVVKAKKLSEEAKKI